jgi:hypothetical protein
MAIQPELDAEAKPITGDKPSATYDQMLAALVASIHNLGKDFAIRAEICLAALNTIRLEQEVVSQEHTRAQVRSVLDSLTQRDTRQGT